MEAWGLADTPNDYFYFLFGKDLKASKYKASTNAAYSRHVKALTAVGVHGQGYDLYSWKHTGVVNAYKAGMDVKAIQAQGRHHSLEMTDIYLRGLGLSTQKLVEGMDW